MGLDQLCQMIDSEAGSGWLIRKWMGPYRNDSKNPVCQFLLIRRTNNYLESYHPIRNPLEYWGRGWRCCRVHWKLIVLCPARPCRRRRGVLLDGVDARGYSSSF